MVKFRDDLVHPILRKCFSERTAVDFSMNILSMINSIVVLTFVHLTCILNEAVLEKQFDNYKKKFCSEKEFSFFADNEK